MNRRRWGCCCLPGCLFLFVLPATFVLYVLKLGTERPADVPPPKRYTQAETNRAQARFKTLKKEAEKTEAAAKANKRVPFKLAVTEDDLNAYILSSREMKRKTEAEGIRDLHVTLGDGTVAVQGGIPFAGEHLWIKAEGPVRAGDRGRIFFDPQKIEFGRLKWALPAATQKQMVERIRSRTNGALLRVPGEIREIKVTPGKMIIRGVSDPDALRSRKEEKTSE